MSDEDVEETKFKSGHFGNRLHNELGNYMGASSKGRQLDDSLKPLGLLRGGCLM